MAAKRGRHTVVCYYVMLQINKVSEPNSFNSNNYEGRENNESTPKFNKAFFLPLTDTAHLYMGEVFVYGKRLRAVWISLFFLT